MSNLTQSPTRPSLEVLAGLHAAAIAGEQAALRFTAHVEELVTRHGYTLAEVLEFNAKAPASPIASLPPPSATPAQHLEIVKRAATDSRDRMATCSPEQRAKLEAAGRERIGTGSATTAPTALPPERAAA